MGTGPRGGRRVREAAEAAKAAEASAPASAADVAAAPPPAKRPKGDAAPPPKVGASVDPEDVDRKAALVLAKRGFAEAAVARFMARAPSASEDASRSFNEQKRLRVAAATAWLLAHAELWELPDAARAVVLLLLISLEYEVSITHNHMRYFEEHRQKLVSLEWLQERWGRAPVHPNRKAKIPKLGGAERLHHGGH